MPNSASWLHQYITWVESRVDASGHSAPGVRDAADGGGGGGGILNSDGPAHHHELAAGYASVNHRIAEDRGSVYPNGLGDNGHHNHHGDTGTRGLGAVPDARHYAAEHNDSFIPIQPDARHGNHYGTGGYVYAHGPGHGYRTIEYPQRGAYPSYFPSGPLPPGPRSPVPGYYPPYPGYPPAQQQSGYPPHTYGSGAGYHHGQTYGPGYRMDSQLPEPPHLPRYPHVQPSFLPNEVARYLSAMEREIHTNLCTDGQDGDGGDEGNGSAREGFEMPNVDFCVLDDGEALLSVSRNDPEILGFIVEWWDYRGKPIDWWRRLGGAIGDNTQLRALRLNLFDLNANDGIFFGAFCAGLAKNRSIEVLECKNLPDGLFSHLAPFFACNPRLRCVVIETWGEVRLRAGPVTSVLSNCGEHSLNRIEVKGVLLSDEGLAEFIESLDRHQNLAALTLSRLRMGPKGCASLSELICTSTMRLQELDISQNDDLDNECIANLINALAKKRDLKTLSLGYVQYGKRWQDVTSQGWYAVFANLHHLLRSLQKLSIELDNEGVTALGHAFRANRSLKNLDLTITGTIGAAAWKLLSLCFQYPESVLEHFRLNVQNGAFASRFAYPTDASYIALTLGNGLARHRRLKSLDMGRIGTFIIPTRWHPINDEVAIAMATGWASTGNTTMKTLNLGNNVTITPVGWRRFFDLLLLSELRLEKLMLPGNNIDDEGAALLVDFCLRNHTLKCLDVVGCPLISATGWQVFVKLLQSPTSTLEELGVSLGGKARDKVLKSYATALAGNTTMKKLAICFRDIRRINPSKGWAALSRALCDTASMNDTYFSNHTLQTIGDDHEIGPIRLLCPDSDVYPFLRMNRNSNKAAVARQKVIRCHFSGPEPSIQVFAGLEWKALPRAIEWIGRDHRGFSLLHQLVRGMPSLFESNTKLGRDNTQ